MSGLELTRPLTPQSPLTSSLYHATTTIDDLTSAIADFSRIPSPEPHTVLTCCCGQEDCEKLKSWNGLRATLNHRLVLSAEVGQALLQRHEAYVRQTERRLKDNERHYSEGHETSRSTSDGLQDELDELMKEKAQLEKQLNRALVNTEVTEVSNKTILQELQEARETISRLTGHHARSVGWETRLATAVKERDDMQQERDGETHRARLAESRFAALKEKTTKLQSDVRRLQESLEEKRQHRIESSQNIIQDAKSRLESFKSSEIGVTAKLAEDELTSVLESLVHDNDVLKRDNGELQHLLTESREEIHMLQEEVDELQANASSYQSRSGANTPHSRHFHSGSVQSITLKEATMFTPRRRNGSVDGRNRRRSNISLRMSPVPPDSQTPEALRSPVSTTASLGPSDNQWASLSRTSPNPSHVSYEIDETAENDGDGSPPVFDKARGHKPLMLLTRSRGTQTEPFTAGTQPPSPFPSHLSSTSPHDAQSESSSFSESQSTHIGSILDKVLTLFNRIAQADALTLTNRLKRQHLKGADVGHLSRSTVSTILAEANNLRVNFRFLLEDDKIITACTRKDLRLLFKFIKDVFTELGQLRVALNEIILDPSSAARMSELALNPGKAEAERKAREAAGQGGPASWMAPISKLFLPTGKADGGSGIAVPRILLPRGNSGGLSGGSGPVPIVRAPRLVPKLGPALAASATTVNVEFSGSGVGRAVTSTMRGQPTVTTGQMATSAEIPSGTQIPSSSSLMGIFAGAPKPIEPSDPWVVLPSSGARRKPPIHLGHSRDSSIGTATVGRAALRRTTNRLSRNVDAVIDNVETPRNDDDEEQDRLPPLLERALRRRGLSDSSIHSTFTKHGEDGDPEVPQSPRRNIAIPAARAPAWPERHSVFQTLSQTLINFGRAAATPNVTIETPLSTEPELTRSSKTSSLRAVPTVESAPSSATALDEPPMSPVESTAESAGSADVGSHPQTPVKKVPQPKASRVASPNRGGRSSILPSLSALAMIDPISGSDPFIASSLRDESYMQRSAGARLGNNESHVRDFY
ncbi:hypothetical protein CPB83DRAFT_855117 [Crepidotus variabilis]|uniref:Uncharacterized protein n=1 Tax=Crepidotus variabilis TaxID=179855 RepID=A0A9P6EEE6_9AGAR|nr:hypothetical protein CPB83DRAFT_855117 [Crepidotus variabilis]